MKNLLRFVGLFFFCLGQSIFADSHSYTYEKFRLDLPELSFMVGGSRVSDVLGNQTLQLLPYEIGPYADTFTNQSNANTFTWGVDAKYGFDFDKSIKNYYLSSFGFGLNFYQITNFKQTGKVLQFNMPVFENYNYKLKLNNIRIMAGIDLDFGSLQSFIFFIEAGIGTAKTDFSYNSTPISPVNSPNFKLPTESSWKFAYQCGAGIKYSATLHSKLFLKYLYANLGKADSSTNGTTTSLATPLTAKFNTNNLFIGVTYLG